MQPCAKHIPLRLSTPVNVMLFNSGWEGAPLACTELPLSIGLSLEFRVCRAVPAHFPALCSGARERQGGEGISCHTNGTFDPQQLKATAPSCHLSQGDRSDNAGQVNKQITAWSSEV